MFSRGFYFTIHLLVYILVMGGNYYYVFLPIMYRACSVALSYMVTTRLWRDANRCFVVVFEFMNVWPSQGTVSLYVSELSPIEVSRLFGSSPVLFSPALVESKTKQSPRRISGRFRGRQTRHAPLPKIWQA